MITTYVLRACVCKDLHRERRHEAGGEFDEMDLAARLRTLQGEEIAGHDDYDKVSWIVSI